MKKIISLCFASFLLCVVSFAQDSSTAANTKKATCKPTKECAAKMGMTLKECKAKCAKSNMGTATKSTSNSKAVSYAASDASSKTSAKKCCASIAECAAKMGMSIEECKAKCKGHGMVKNSESKTAVASAVMVDNVEEAPKGNMKKSCAKSGKKCCAKKKQ